MAKLDDQISTLEDKLKQLKLRQQRLEARQRAVQAQRERKAELRRRILVGGVVLERMRKGGIAEAELRVWLDQGLTRADERAFFELPALD